MQLTHVCVIYLGCLEAKFESLHSSYQCYKVTINKWNKLQSGSAGRPKYKPKSYKYAAELSFLDDVTISEKTDENVTTDTSTTDNNDKVCT